MKFPGVDTLLGPEMKCTGEVMGIDSDFGRAYAKAQIEAGNSLPSSGTVLVSVRLEDRAGICDGVRELAAQRLPRARDAGDGRGAARARRRGRDGPEGRGAGRARRGAADRGGRRRPRDQHRRARSRRPCATRPRSGAPRCCAISRTSRRWPAPAPRSARSARSSSNRSACGRSRTSTRPELARPASLRRLAA